MQISSLKSNSFLKYNELIKIVSFLKMEIVNEVQILCRITLKEILLVMKPNCVISFGTELWAEVERALSETFIDIWKVLTDSVGLKIVGKYFKN